MPYKVRLFQRNSTEKIHTSTINMRTPLIGDRIKVPIGPVQIEATVVGVFRTHHSEETDMVDAYEDETPQATS